MLLDFLLSFFSLLCLWLMGNKSKYGPPVGLLGQVFWMYFTITNGYWFLLVCTFIYTFIHARNTLKWIREERFEQRKWPPMVD